MEKFELDIRPVVKSDILLEKGKSRRRTSATAGAITKTKTISILVQLGLYNNY